MRLKCLDFIFKIVLQGFIALLCLENSSWRLWGERLPLNKRQRRNLRQNSARPTFGCDVKSCCFPQSRLKAFSFVNFAWRLICPSGGVAPRCLVFLAVPLFSLVKAGLELFVSVWSGVNTRDMHPSVVFVRDSSGFKSCFQFSKEIKPFSQCEPSLLSHLLWILVPLPNKYKCMHFIKFFSKKQHFWVNLVALILTRTNNNIWVSVELRRRNSSKNLVWNLQKTYKLMFNWAGNKKKHQNPMALFVKVNMAATCPIVCQWRMLQWPKNPKESTSRHLSLWLFPLEIFCSSFISWISFIKTLTLVLAKTLSFLRFVNFFFCSRKLLSSENEENLKVQWGRLMVLIVTNANHYGAQKWPLFCPQ